MAIDPNFSVFISFVGFLFIFLKKIYPFVTKKLDEHIKSVKDKIDETENMYKDTAQLLKGAYVKKDEIDVAIENYKLESAERLKRIEKENEMYITLLRERYEISLKKQIESELAKQKSILINKISDIIVEKISDMPIDRASDTKLTKEDIERLLI